MPTAAQMRSWITAWKGNTQAMRAIKRAELRSIDFWSSVLALNDAHKFLVDNTRSNDSSGLVIQQALFHKGRRGKSI